MDAEVHQSADECGWLPVGDQFAISPQEYRIAACTAAGMSIPQISKAMRLTEGTVKVYRARLYAKLGVHGEAALAVAFVKGQLRVTDKWKFRTELENLAIDNYVMPAIALRVAASEAIRRKAVEREKSRLAHKGLKKTRQMTPAQQVEAERWNKIFAEKFEDPSYYERPAVRTNSALSSAGFR